MHPTLYVYSLFARAGFLLALLVGFLAAIQFLWVDGWHGLQAFPPILLILWVFYVMWWSPLLVVTDNALVAFNVWRRVRVPWGELTRAKLHLGVVLETSAGDFRLSTAQPKNRLSELRNPGADPVPHIDFSRERVSVHMHAQQLVEILTQWQELHADFARYGRGSSVSSSVLPEGALPGFSSSEVQVVWRWQHFLGFAVLLGLNAYVWFY